MQTLQILPVSTPAAPQGSASAPAAEGPGFEQVLTRQVAERNAAQNKPSEPAAPKEDSAPAAEAAQATEAAQAEAAPERAEGPETESARDVAAASAELLALVASIAQFQGAAAPSAKTGTEAGDLLQGAGNGRNAALAALQDMADASQLAAEGIESDLLAGARGAPAAAADFDAALKEVSLLLQSAQQPAPQAIQQSSAAQAAAAALGDRIAPRVGSSGWDQALGQKIVWMVSGEHQSASLELNPPELGPLKVVLQVSNATANAAFVAAQPEVRQALEAAMPRLREMLNEAGIQLGQASVDSGTQQDQPAERHAGGARASGMNAADAAPTAVTPLRPTAGGLGMVDTFA